MSKTSAITVYQVPYSYSYEGGYTGDVTITSSSAHTYVEILDIKKKFEDDKYMHAAKAWVNETFATDEYKALKDSIIYAEKEIESLKETIRAAEVKMNTFLVPVELSEF